VTDAAPASLWARQVWLTDFRNHAATEVELASGLSVITGRNGEGKTNLLEALGYAATGRSFRGASVESLVRQGADVAAVRVAGARGGREFLVEAELRVGGRSRFQLNRQRVNRTRDLYDALLVSVFTPDDLDVVKGAPAGRRTYLDDTLVSCRPRHEALCRDVERILRQKSALLKQARGSLGGEVRTTLDVWNDQLTEAGTRLGEARVALLDALGPRVEQAYRDIAQQDAHVTLEYRSDWREAGLRAALAAAEVDEVRRGVCLVGPHRDDVAVTLDGLPSRSHPSQGEQRTLALALRLGAHRLVGDAAGVYPVLLLDDIFSELDPVRSSALLAHLPPGQAVLTTASGLPEGVSPDLVLQVVGGHAAPLEVRH